MKKKFAFAALAVAAGCAVTLSGCANSAIINTAALSSNWYAYTSYKKIQPDFIGDENAERAEYKVTFTKNEVENSSYSVQFGQEGSYTTLFYATDFDYENLADSDYKEGYAAAADGGKIQAYYYKTELILPEMTYTAGDKTTEKLTESVITESYFLPVSDSLRPLYSKTIVYNHSPAGYSVSSAKEAYFTVDRTYENYYKYDGRAVKTKIVYGADDFEYSDKPGYSVYDSLSDADYVLFDNYSLNIAARAMNLTSDLSQNISLYAPNSGVQNYTLTGSDGALGEDETAAFGAILGKKYKLGGELGSVAVSVRYSGDIRGVEQKLWFAAVSDKTNNKPRATMLKLTQNLPYRLGALNYELINLG